MKRQKRSFRLNNVNSLTTTKDIYLQVSCLVLPSLLKSKKGFLLRIRDRTGPRFRSLRFLSIGRFFTEERFQIIFLFNTLIVDTLKHCALKLSQLSTELDIASLSLLRSFHNIMHREGTISFTLSEGFFISFKFIFVFCNFIHVSFFYRLCRWLILFGTNVGLLGGVDLDLTAGKHNIQVRGLEISADQVKQTIFCPNSFNN